MPFRIRRYFDETYILLQMGLSHTGLDIGPGFTLANHNQHDRGNQLLYRFKHVNQVCTVLLGRKPPHMTQKQGLFINLWAPSDSDSSIHVESEPLHTNRFTNNMKRPVIEVMSSCTSGAGQQLSRMLPGLPNQGFPYISSHTSDI